MADTTKRIIDLDQADTLSSNDYLVVDSPTAGTRKINVTSLYEGLTLIVSDDDNGTLAITIGGY